MAQFRGHNEAVLRTLEVGDLIEFDRVLFTHWGVYIGGEEIVHLYFDKPSGEGCVKKENFWSVAGQYSVKKNNDKDRKWRPLCPEEIKKRALLRLGTSPYDVLHYNCERFANWCRYGKFESEQADSTGFFGTIAISVAAIFGIATSVSHPSVS